MYENPVYAHDAPDPSVMQGNDGAYYAYSTQAGYWPMTLVNTPVMRSTDLTNWSYVGDAFSQRPAWVSGDMWAPHVVPTGDHFTMVYSGRKSDGKMAVGYATSPTAVGPFTDRGILVESESWGHEIDPYVLQDGTDMTMYWGSGPEGIYAQHLTAARDGSLALDGDRHTVLVPSGDRSTYEQMSEGAWVVKHDGWYYLMTSGDDWKSHYAVKVARSRSPLGPFEQRREPMLASSDAWLQPGHHSMIQDAGGHDWIVYHAWKAADPQAGRQMLLDRVEWQDGWPVVNGGAGPSGGWQPAPVTDARVGSQSTSSAAA